jgi:hypothetical protein
MAALRPKLVLGAVLIAAVAAACGGRSWPASYGDPVGDVDHGPDLASVRVSNTDAGVSFALLDPALGDRRPERFTFTVAAARESGDEGTGGGFDVAPQRGTLSYVLAG